MEREPQRETALTVSKSHLPQQAAPAREGYWQRTAKRYTRATRVLLIALLLFVLLFSAICSDAFAYNNVFYFGKDLFTLSALNSEGDSVLYYTYGEEGALPVSYRGGIAVVHRGGTETYDAAGNRLMTVTGQYKNPRVAVSRGNLVSYDFGGTDFCVSNPYLELYRGTTERAIYRAFISDSGYFTLICASETALCDVLLYDANFRLAQRFSRGGATVCAVVSPNGRYVAIADATDKGTLVEVYAVGDSTPATSFTVEGFPLSLSFEGSTYLSLLTDKGAHAFHVGGKAYGATSFEGAALYTFDAGENGTALVLETNRTQNAYRLVVLDKKGNVKLQKDVTGAITAVSLADDTVWVLQGDNVSCLRLKDGSALLERTVPAGAIGISALSNKTAQVLFPAEALLLRVR